MKTSVSNQCSSTGSMYILQKFQSTSKKSCMHRTSMVPQYCNSTVIVAVSIFKLYKHCLML